MLCFLLWTRLGVVIWSELKRSSYQLVLPFFYLCWSRWLQLRVQTRVYCCSDVLQSPFRQRRLCFGVWRLEGGYTAVIFNVGCWLNGLSILGKQLSGRQWVVVSWFAQALNRLAWSPYLDICTLVCWRLFRLQLWTWLGLQIRLFCLFALLYSNYVQLRSHQFLKRLKIQIFLW